MPNLAARCVSCHQQIDAQWPFCAYCGADNRPPEQRSPVPAHAHDFSKGYHCIYCGISYAEEGKKEPVRGLIYKNYSLRAGFWTAAFFCGIFFFVTNFPYPRAPEGKPYFIGAFILFVLLGLCAVRKVMVDIDRHEVRELMGVWPLVKLKVYPFAAVQGVIAGIRISYGRYGSTTYFPIRIMAGATLIDVKEFRDSSYAAGVGHQIAATIGVPFQNEMGAYYWRPGMSLWW